MTRKYRDAQINVVSNGFIVTIGCQKIVAETPDGLLKRIEEYLKDPEGAENKLMENSMVFRNDCPSATVGVDAPSGENVGLRTPRIVE